MMLLYGSQRCNGAVQGSVEVPRPGTTGLIEATLSGLVRLADGLLGRGIGTGGNRRTSNSGGRCNCTIGGRNGSHDDRGVLVEAAEVWQRSDVMSVSCKEKHRKISNGKTSVKAKQNTNV